MPEHDADIRERVEAAYARTHARLLEATVKRLESAMEAH